MGTLIAGFLWTWFFGWLLCRKAWRDVGPEGRARNATMVGAAVTGLLAAIGYGNPIAALFYMPTAALAYIPLLKGYRKAWIDDDSTFD